MRRDISLNPDYRPWKGVLVKLRKKKRACAWPVFLFLGLALIFGVYLKESARAKGAGANAPAPPVATATAVVAVAVTASPATVACPPSVGTVGYVTLSYRDGCAVTRLKCVHYHIGDRRGDTLNTAPVVPVSGRAVTVLCDDVVLEVPLP